MQSPFEQFPALSAIGICRHAFAQRIPGIDVSHDKAEVLKRLDAAHREIRNAIGVGDWPYSPPNRFMEIRSQWSMLQACRLRDEFPRLRWHHHQSTRNRAGRLRR